MDKKTLEKDISKRIWITRYFMIIGIIILHLPPYKPLSEVNGPFFEYIKAFLSHGVFRAAVPVLTAISGYLIFKSRLYLYPKKLVKKKFFSIIYPLIIWNIPFAVFIFAVQKYNLLSHDFSAKLYPFDLMAWINALTGLTESPVNYPLNFLRDLFIISILSPLFWQLIKRAPYTGLVLILVIYQFNLDGQLILRNPMIVSFYLGALAANQQWDLKRLDKYAPILLSIFIAICIAIIYFKIENRNLFRLVSPFLIWPSMSLLENSRAGKFLHNYSKNSFLTFLSHGPLILIIWILFQKIPADIPYLVYWIAAPIITVIITILANRLLHKVPKLAAILLGGR